MKKIIQSICICLCILSLTGLGTYFLIVNFDRTSTYTDIPHEGVSKPSTMVHITEISKQLEDTKPLNSLIKEIEVQHKAECTKLVNMWFIFATLFACALVSMGILWVKASKKVVGYSFVFSGAMSIVIYIACRYILVSLI
ncbi:MAG: hypothetical protein RSC09_06120 [Clostridia bacterium]